MQRSYLGGTMFRFLRLALAIFRLVLFILKDDFPPMKKIRDWSIWYPWFHDLLHCHRCLGIHCSWIILLIDQLQIGKFIVDILALAGAVILIFNSWGKLGEKGKNNISK